MKNHSFLHIASIVDGVEGSTISQVLVDLVPTIMGRLSHVKQVARAGNLNWAENASLMLGIISAHYGDLAAEECPPKLGEIDLFTLSQHTRLAVWLLHHLGRLREAKKRAVWEMVVLRITPELGLNGIRVSFEPLPAALLAAANDNQPRKRRRH